MHESQWCATVHSQIHSDTPFGQRAVCYILMPPCHILCYTRAAKGLIVLKQLVGEKQITEPKLCSATSCSAAPWSALVCLSPLSLLPFWPACDPCERVGGVATYVDFTGAGIKSRCWLQGQSLVCLVPFGPVCDLHCAIHEREGSSPRFHWKQISHWEESFSSFAALSV